MSNINDTFFDGHYKEIWKTLIPDELTVKEVDFMVPHFGLQPGSKVLDLMCGYGRHAIALAKKGIVVTAVDNLGDYIDEIKQVAEKDNLPLQAVKHDVITYPLDADFDLAICMGNSLNFFNASDLGTIAAKKAIEDAGINPETLDQIIVAQNFGNVLKNTIQTDAVPSIASRIKHTLGIHNPNCVCYDILFGCPGWLPKKLM